jgi:hypothetical protein
MKTTDFSATITSSKLKENINKMFGLNVHLDKYDREQLEDMRNKLRTRVFQQEGKAGINDLLTNETYQKDKAMLDLLNTRIKEMLGEDIKKLRDKMVELSEGKKGVKAPKYKIHAQGTAAKDSDDGKKTPAKKPAVDKKIKEGAKPDFLDIDKDGDKKEPMKKAAADKKVKEGAKPDFLDIDKDGDKKEPMKKAAADKKVKEGAKPDFLDIDKDGDKKEPMKKAAADKKAGPKKGVNPFAKKDESVEEGFPTVAKATADAEKKKTTGKFDKKDVGTGTQYTRKASTFTDGGDDSDTKKAKKAAKLKEAHSIYKRHVAIVNESIAILLSEDEEGKAKAITAAGDMVNDFTSWMQRVGQYQTKTMIELADAIKADFGAQEAEAFKAAVGPALSATLEILTQQREAVSNAVAVLAGEATPDVGMGMEPGMDASMAPEPSMDIAAPDDMNAPAGDEFGASDAAAGMGTTGREMRESRFARKLAESHSIMSKLAK